MKFFVDTNELNAGIATVIKALPSRTTLSILEGIYIKAAGNQLLLRCTDLTIQIDTVISATVEKDGAIVLPGKLFSELMRKLTGDTVSFDVNTKKNSAVIECGSFKTTLQGEDSEDYHVMSDVNSESSFSIDSDSVKRMVRGSIFAAAQDDSKPILTGVLMELEDECLKLVALDGYRLAMRREHIKGNYETQSELVIPARSLVEIARIAPEGEEPVKMIFSKTHVMADMNNTRLTARLMEGEFIRYKKILPDSHVTRVRIKRRELMDGIDRVALMARESKTNLIKFSIGSGMVNITANSEIGNASEDIIADINGSDLEIAFNAKYFTDVLKVLDSEDIYLDFNSSVNPCVVRPVQGNEYYYLILPVRIFSGM